MEQMMPAIGTDSIPMNISKAVRNNAGGVYNHLLFFKVWQACMPCLSGALRPHMVFRSPLGMCSTVHIVQVLVVEMLLGI